MIDILFHTRGIMNYSWTVYITALFPKNYPKPNVNSNHVTKTLVTITILMVHDSSKLPVMLESCVALCSSAKDLRESSASFRSTDRYIAREMCMI